MQSVDQIIDSLRLHLPEFIARAEVPTLLGGMVSAKTLANADSQLEGPEGSFRCGRKVVYPKESLLRWLRPRLAMIREDGDAK
ncbi:hypothetical protein PCS_01974 [Desulfocurvibacter africanus PCS]|uniref:Uncharacterized protein n=1 Tax=Desulfocurvibacter africanus PCS TaxID=1262666 RepID=M5Q258_DESAF|nr:hypothetical protein PCS_01974 [Desulfocurvibacter africanus PCS]